MAGRWAGASASRAPSKTITRTAGSYIPKTIERLRGIQWQPMAEIWPVVLQRFRAGGKPVQVYVTTQGALDIKKERGGKGCLLHIVNETLTVEHGQAFLETFEDA
jgi:hypothetical protein